MCRYELQQKSIFHFFNINEIIGQGMKIQIFLGNIDLSTKMRKSDRMIYIRSIFVSVTNSMKRIMLQNVQMYQKLFKNVGKLATLIVNQKLKIHIH